MSNDIRDTTQLKNSINGFEIAECNIMPGITIYINIPNMGAGLLLQSAFLATGESTEVKSSQNFGYNLRSLKEEVDHIEKHRNFTILKGLSKDMFLNSFTAEASCGGVSNMNNNFSSPIPIKISSNTDSSSIIHTKGNTISAELFNSEDIIPFDFYTSMLKGAIDITEGESEAYITDSIVLQNIKQVVNGIDLLNIETIESEEETDNPEIIYFDSDTRWSIPYFKNINNYSPVTTRIEYSDLFTDIISNNYYLTKASDGRKSDVNIQDIFTKPSVLFTVHNDDNKRLFYSKELSDYIFNNIKIEGSQIPPKIEFSKSMLVFSNSATLLYSTILPIGDVEDILDIGIEEYDTISGSGYSIKKHLDNIIPNITNTISRDPISQNIIQHSNNIIIQRPPIFSLGEMYGLYNNNQYEYRIPLYSSYVVPIIDNNFANIPELISLEYSGNQEFMKEGFHELHIMYNKYADIINSNKTTILMQCPVSHPVDDTSLIYCINHNSWRLFNQSIEEIKSNIINGYTPVSRILSGTNIVPPLRSLGTIRDFIYDSSNMSDKAFETYNIVREREVDHFLNMLSLYGSDITTSSDYDYNQYPVIITDMANSIIPQDESNKLSLNINNLQGIAIDDDIKSISTINNNLSLSEEGNISTFNLFNSFGKSNRIDNPIYRMVSSIDTISTILSKLNSINNENILYIYSTKTITLNDIDYIVPGTMNFKSSLIDEVISSKLPASDIYISNIGNLKSSSFERNISSLVSLLNKTTGSNLSNIYDRVKRGNNADFKYIKQNAYSFINNEIREARIICEQIASILLSEKGLYCRLPNNQHGYLNFSDSAKRSGFFYFNIVKSYLLIISIFSLILSYIDHIHHFLLSVIKDYTPAITSNFEKYTIDFNAFIFQNSSNKQPLYPILNNIINIEDLDNKDIGINEIVELFEPEQYSYNLDLSIGESLEDIEGITTVMPGIGILNSLLDFNDVENIKFIWNKDSVFSSINNKDIVNMKFTEIQNSMIANSDYMQIIDGVISAINHNNNQKVLSPISKENLEKSIRNTKKTISEVPAIKITSKIDCNKFFPFLDSGISIISNATNIAPKFISNRPININNNTGISDDTKTLSEIYNTNIRENINIIDILLNNIVNTDIFESITPTIEEYKKISEPISKRILDNNILDGYISDLDNLKDINIKLISNSLLYHSGPYTNISLQSFLFPEKTNRKLNDIDIINDLKHDGWKDFNGTPSSIIKQRNYNYYLSKRRSYYSGLIIFLLIYKELLEICEIMNYQVLLESDNIIKIVTNSHTLGIKLMPDESTPSGSNVYKLFDAYGFGGLLMELPNSDDNIYYTNSLITNAKVSFTKKDSSNIGVNKKDSGHINFSIDFEKSEVSLPTSSIIFPTSYTKGMSYLNYRMTKSQIYNTLNTLYYNESFEYSKAYNSNNTNRARNEAIIFIKNNLDNFKVNSFIDRLWIIIE